MDLNPVQEINRNQDLMKNNITIAVIGAGSWGTALALLLAGKDYVVRLWGHNHEHVDELVRDRENKKYLPDNTFPENLLPVDRLEQALEGTSIIVMAVPSHAYRQVFVQMIPYLQQNSRVLSAVKGIENSTLMTMTEVMAEVLVSQKCTGKKLELGVISGPSFAKEVAQRGTYRRNYWLS